MNKLIPVWIYVLSLVLLAAVLILYFTGKDNRADDRINQLRYSVSIFENKAAYYQAAADSAQVISEFFRNQAMTAIRETVSIHNTHEQIRNNISALPATDGIRLLSKTLQPH